MNSWDEIKLILVISVIGYAMFLLKETVKYIRLRRLFTLDINRLKHGIILVDDLHDNLTPNEFEHWCGEFLEKEGFLEVFVTAKGPDGGKDIICRKGNDKSYVECKRYAYSNNAKFKVDDNIVRKLIGAMAGDNITSGIIITSGLFTDEAIKYIETLPSRYKFEFYDGQDLVKEYEVLRTLKLCE